MTQITIPETMRAAIWEGDTPRLHIEDIPVPVPKKDEALVRITSCGVCHTDLHVLKGEVAFPGPGVVGHEISGEVVSIGEGTEDAGQIGVGAPVIGAFIMPCTECEQCLRGRDDLCEKFFGENRLKGNLFDGTSRLATADGRRLSMYSMAGMAEYSVVPISALTLRPANVPPEESAILGCAAFTAYGAVRKSGLVEGETVAVVAVGGVGSSLIQVAKHEGASKVIAIDVTDEKLESARRLGADETINSTKRDPKEAVLGMTDGKGVHVAFEALGRPETFTQAASLLREGGRMVAIGIAPGGVYGEVEISPLVRRGQTVTGSFGAVTRVDLPAVANLAAEGGYRLREAVTRRYDLADVDDAYQALDRGEITGRAIVVM
ncbi:zinc-binding dehydrogenase [Rothia uropygialis]|uniref:zinc-binding dehydrogenase n=1 Tax=Kocuria sp. 36 TaxID=1415402 RepID=UPI001930F02C|nr:zinc-binding dehydrogenase [Kocuria sp. 36]